MSPVFTRATELFFCIVICMLLSPQNVQGCERIFFANTKKCSRWSCHLCTTNHQYRENNSRCYRQQTFFVRCPDQCKSATYQQKNATTDDLSEKTKKIVLTVTINKVGPYHHDRLKQWLVEATAIMSENQDAESQNAKINFLVHSPLKSFRTMKVQGETFVIEFDETFKFDELYSGDIRAKKLQ